LRKLWLVLFGLIVITGGAYTWVMFTPSGQDVALRRALVAMGQGAAEVAAREAAVDALRVFLCGTSSPLPDLRRAQACVAVRAGEVMYIVDAGAGSTAVLAQGGMPMQRLRGVLLTHYHSDHISALADIGLNAWVTGRDRPLEVIGPDGVEDVVAGFNQAYALDRSYRVAHHGADLLPPAGGLLAARTVAAGDVIEDAGLVITAFVVNHDPVRPAFGYRFDYRGRSVVVSGDTIVTEGLANASRNADLLLNDALSVPIVSALSQASRDAGIEWRARILHDIMGYHAHTEDVVKLARDAGVGQLAFYHLVPPPQNALFERIFMRGVPSDVVLTEDGMEFELAVGSDAIELSERLSR